MSEMLERVARAIYGSSGPKTPNHTWDDCIQQAPMLADCYRDHARAVIAAMREPTDAMLHAGLVAVNLQNSYLNVVQHAMIDVVYRAMIDEALK